MELEDASSGSVRGTSRNFLGAEEAEDSGRENRFFADCFWEPSAKLDAEEAVLGRVMSEIDAVLEILELADGALEGLSIAIDDLRVRSTSARARLVAALGVAFLRESLSCADPLRAGDFLLTLTGVLGA